MGRWRWNEMRDRPLPPLQYEATPQQTRTARHHKGFTYAQEPAITNRPLSTIRTPLGGGVGDASSPAKGGLG
ncbi:hypothetical protein, partial [Thermoleptolyngbya sp. M55_K2018_002]|uniref:hypothetical protein n=1 Tax=Thermoleptolyngbya sp. M55_K2018_002 TaxID=2747808 RepID=UPI0025E1FD7C